MAKVYRRKYKDKDGNDREGPWVADYRVNGRRRIHKIPAKNITEARRILNSIRGKLAEGTFALPEKKKRRTFATLCDEFLEKHSRHKKPRTHKHNTGTVKILKAYFGEATLVENITSFKVESFISHRKDEITRRDGDWDGKVGHNAINRNLACLKTMFNCAVRWKWVPENPVKGVNFLTERKRAYYQLSESEERWLLEAAETLAQYPYMKTVIITALNTGMRWGEIVNLQWADVDFVQEVITVRDTKNGETRDVEMNGHLAPVLWQWREQRPFDEDVFPVGDFKKGWDASRKL